MPDDNNQTIDELSTAKIANTAGANTAPSEISFGLRSGDVWPVIAAFAAVGAGLTRQAPTGNAFADFVFPAALAAVVVWLSQTATANAVRLSALLCLVFTALQFPAAWFGLAAVAVALTGVMLPLERQTRMITLALTAALVSQVALRLPSYRFIGSASILAVIGLAPILVTGVQGLAARPRQILTRSLLGFGVFSLLATGLATAAAGSVRDDVLNGIDAARDGVQAIENGDQERAVGLLEDSRIKLNGASGRLSGPLTWPSRIVPIVGHQTRAVEIAVDEGAQLATTAARVVTVADVEQIRGSNGAIDLDLVNQLNLELTNANLVLRDSRASLRESRAPWLLPQLDRRIVEIEDELTGANNDIDLANLGTYVVPRILGSEELRRYLVIFTQPSEAREFGGFVAAYALLEAKDGQITLADSGPALDILKAAEDAEIENFADFPPHYANSRPDLFPQNLTSTPHLPSITAMAAEIVPKWQDNADLTVHGVIVMDPYAVAGLLELTGPIAIEGRSEPLTPDNVVEFLLRGQYTEFEDDGREERQDSLGDLASRTFEQLLSVEVPGPERLGAIFGPIARANRLAVATLDDEENAFLNAVALSADLPEVGSAVDMLGLYTTTRIASKVAAYESHVLNYTVDVDPGAKTATGRVDLDITNSIPNDAPGYVAGNDGGNNWIWLSLYTRAEIQGFKELALGEPREGTAYSYLRYSVELEVPPGTTERFSFDTFTELQDDRYDLFVPAQAGAQIGELNVTIRPAAGWRIVGLPTAADGTWTGSLVHDTGKAFTFFFERV